MWHLHQDVGSVSWNNAQASSGADPVFGAPATSCKRLKDLYQGPCISSSSSPASQAYFRQSPTILPPAAMPSYTSLLSSAIGALLLLSSPTLAFSEQCSAFEYPLSCHNKSAVANTCCFNCPGGLLLQTQFWDTNPATGPADHWTVHGLWSVAPIPSHPCLSQSVSRWLPPYSY